MEDVPPRRAPRRGGGLRWPAATAADPGERMVVRVVVLSKLEDRSNVTSALRFLHGLSRSNINFEDPVEY